MLKIASCDSQGAVFIANDAVYRLIDPKHKAAVLSVFTLLNVESLTGLIQTEICPAGKYPCAIEGANENALILKHRKIEYISYPHEWCASMLKDAALFHLVLSEQLLKHGLFLKDAHPWNILFEKGLPKFIDFTSIVSRESLFAEEYLESNKLHHADEVNTHLAAVCEEIYARMYFPYFVNPLGAYAFGKRSKVRKLIENTTLNSSTSTISIRDCIPEIRPRLSVFNKLMGLWKLRSKMRKLTRLLSERKSIHDFYQGMREGVEALDVAAGDSNYSAYYQLKGEDHDWVYSEEWNDKQKSVYSTLNLEEIRTVLDVACNTGWFAVMAEKLHKRVVAFDIDEACIESLYGKVKREQLNILPLVMNFTELTEDRYSIHDGKQVLINAPERLRSDAVIALGILHHLVLGLGLSFETVLDRLIPLCEKQLVIEFVDSNDAVIQDEPSFFPAYYQNKNLLTGYDLSSLIELCKERGFEVECQKSHPSTRTILVCRKLFKS
ncbi:Methyltransferase domain protein [compost metagenome]